MASFPKIWTSILHEDWWLQMPCIERGMLLQLFLIAKVQGDTGRISYRSVANLSADLYIERRTFSKVMAKFTECGRIIVEKHTDRIYTIFIPKYREYQDLDSGSPSRKRGKFTDTDGKYPTLKRTELNQTELNGKTTNVVQQQGKYEPDENEW